MGWAEHVCRVRMTSNARACLLVASLLDASSTGVSKTEVPACASGVQPAQLCDSSPVMGSVSFANLCGFDFSERGRVSVKMEVMARSRELREEMALETWGLEKPSQGVKK